ncbi:MAG: 4Fe-4S dicluster domain-containing protein [Halobacteriota archaeon]
MTEDVQSLDPEMREEIEGLQLDPAGNDGVELGMVIDLHQCVGCGGCNIACKQENNLQEGVAFSSNIIETKGQFPDVAHQYTPTLCNQCQDAPCAEGCPTSALYKGEGGIVMHDPEQCIGCKYCKINCPYEEIHFNKEKPHKRWDSEEATVEGMTASPKELAEETTGEATPYYNPNRETAEHEHPTRYKGVVEKCTFCVHRVKQGELPACVEACPADARVFGDLNDPDSKVNEILGKHQPEVRKEKEGTHPKVMYVRSYNGGSYETGKGEPGLGD